MEILQRELWYHGCLFISELGFAAWRLDAMVKGWNTP